MHSERSYGCGRHAVHLEVVSLAMDAISCENVTLQNNYVSA